MLAAGSVLADNINGININFANIGSAGYAADFSTGYGYVGYNYRIGQTEVSIAQFQASGIIDADANYWNDGTRNVGQDAPAVSLSWHEAAQYCNWLTSSNTDVGAYTIVGGLVTAIDRSYRNANGVVYVLPTEDEWYKAAYFTGSGYSLYANGTGTAPTHGVDANFNTAGGYSGGPAWLVGSGSLETNGTYNMMGNVWEWLESAADGNLDSIGEDVAFRGGDYFQGVGYLQSSNRSFDTPTGEYYNTGLRIVAIPEPGTISLMSLSTISLFFTRTIRRRKLAGKSLIPVGREYLCDTFATYEEWEAAYGQMEETDYLAELRGRIKAWFGSAWNEFMSGYKALDKKFWGRMVLIHERKMERKRTIKAALKKKALDGLDAFLALIMK